MCPDAGADRDVEAYKAVRAHELTLNEARAELERGALAPLIALNGGAIVAFLTLIGAVSKNVTFNVSSGWRWAAALSAGAAIVVWAAGLLFAARAVQWASRQQGEINTGYRLMRELVEAQIAPRVAPDISAPRPDPTKDRWKTNAKKKREKKQTSTTPTTTGTGKPTTAATASGAPAGLSSLLGLLVVAGVLRRGRRPPTTTARARARKETDEDRKDASDFAKFAGNRRERSWQGSVLAFVVGAALALAGIGCATVGWDNKKTTITTVTTTGPGEPATTKTSTTTTTTP